MTSPQTRINYNIADDTELSRDSQQKNREFRRFFMKSYTLGLDIGSNSVGWALLEDGEQGAILDIGVRVFPEGVDRDTKGAELSKNANRRMARGGRRIKYRRSLRKNKLLREMQDTGLWPRGADETARLLGTNPYPLRAKGLDEKLELFELGRVLFHINQRRGFLSNRKTGKASDNNTVAKSANELQRLINEAGCRSLGEYLSGLDKHQQRIRERYTFRSMYVDEFDKIWDKQAEYWPDVLTEDLGRQFRNETIFFQRPLKPSDHLIGMCDLEPEERRSPKGNYYARRFRLLQDVNNLRIQNADGSEQMLTEEQRSALLYELSHKKELSYDKMRQLLQLLDSQQFNLEEGGKNKKLKGDEFAAGMIAVFGESKWEKMYEEEKVEINDAVLERDDEELQVYLREKYDLDDKRIEKVKKISLPQKYMSFSVKAIKKLLGPMEAGAITSDAIGGVYGWDSASPDAEHVLDRLPLPDDLRNPIVNKAMFEVRKVVNAIIRQYGKPARIVVEMAREVKGSLSEREDIQFKMRQNQNRNEEADQVLMTEMDIRNPKYDDRLKYKLWLECGKICPYTGKSICQRALFGSEPEFQIEHIIPYSRSLDDSYMNKTLCWVDENRRKGEKMPYEFYEGTSQYEEILQRIACLPWPKRRKFLQKEIELDKCIERELNDTRYICKQIIAYLRQLGVIVKGTRGKVTAELRHGWGLNNILDLTGAGLKNRDDHRHHAVDAAVVAVTTNEHLRMLAHSKYSVTGEKFTEPWLGFRQSLAEAVNKINVSHRVTRKASGQLHEETSYGLGEDVREFFKQGEFNKEDIRQLSTNVWLCQKKFEYIYSRPPVDILKQIKDIDSITPDAVNIRDAIAKRLIDNGIDPTDKQANIDKLFKDNLFIEGKDGKKTIVKKVRVKTNMGNMLIFCDKQGKPYRASPTGGNHHVEIFRSTQHFDKKGKAKMAAKVISLFEVVQRSRHGQPIIQKDYTYYKNNADDMKFVCSLAINDMVMLPDKDGQENLYRVQKMDINGQIYFRHHTAATIGSESTVIRRQATVFDGYKVSIDPLGEIHKAND
jgi:CRISPR-associated endonuclease Csn1